MSKQYDKRGDATSTLIQGVSQGYSPIELYNIGQIKTFSPQTDVYSLAATLYYLVTSTVPPAASQIYEDGIQIPSNISASLRAAIETGMQVSRSKRPISIAAFLTKLLSANKLFNQNIFNEKEKTEYIFVENDDTIVIDPLNLNKKANSQSNKFPREKGQNYVENRKKSKTVEEGTGGKWYNSRNYEPKIKDNKILIFLIIILIITLLLPLIIMINVSHTSQPQESKNNANVESTNNIVQGNTIETAQGEIIYYGIVDNNGKPHGQGNAYLQYGLGEYYDGKWNHGNMDGKAYYRLRNGDTFEGYFKNNKYDRGKYTIKSSGEYFVGTFHNGLPHKGNWYDKNERVLDTLN